jgi:SAM-dependent methyltransferase
MKEIEYIKPDFPADAFVGTAYYYTRYREPYPKSLIDDLINRAAGNTKSKLLDLACGPGRLTLPLAPSFKEVWAVDIEPEMIEVGKEEAERRRINNIKWIVGKAEDLEAEPASFDLITIASAFHRLDQRIIGELAFDWLAPGGSLAIIGCYAIIRGTEQWQGIVADIVHKWVSRSVSDNDGPSRPVPCGEPEHNRLVLRDKGFEDVDTYSFVEPYEWTIESIIGTLYSTSRSSKKVLGKNAKAFEDELTATLLAYDENGKYQANLDCGYTLGRKPLDA